MVGAPQLEGKHPDVDLRLFSSVIRESYHFFLQHNVTLSLSWKHLIRRQCMGIVGYKLHLFANSVIGEAMTQLAPQEKGLFFALVL